MPTAETLFAFFTASCLLALAPGPDNLFVLAQSALHGRTAGLIITCGLCTGLLVHTAAVALGLAAIFKTSLLAFTILKYCGAAYLLWLAWQALRAKAETAVTNPAVSVDGQCLKLYRRGIIMNITNPKVSLFFLAFLPQFTDPARGALSTQIILLGGLFILATLLIFGAVALLAGALAERLNGSPRIQTVMNRLAGILFIALALKLAGNSR